MDDQPDLDALNEHSEVEENAEQVSENIQRKQKVEKLAEQKKKKQKEYLHMLHVFMKKELARRERLEIEKQRWRLNDAQLAQYHKTSVQLLQLFKNKTTNTNDDANGLAAKYLATKDEQNTLDFLSILMFYTKVTNLVRDQSDLTYHMDAENKMVEKIALHSKLDYQNLHQQLR
jgi:hypothetical protein